VSKKLPTEDKLSQLTNFFKENLKDLHQKEPLPDMNSYKIPLLYHYTSLLKLFLFLENDELWFSGVRFSNDSSEEILLGDEWLFSNEYHSDSYIFCIGDTYDLLSQWRGYCPNGGASIGFDVARRLKYSVLHADFNKSKKFNIVDGIALPVLYTTKEPYKKTDAQGIIRIINAKLKEDHQNKNKYSLLEINDFVPYIKHYAFHEEKERRILISNSNEELSKCVRFRILDNGTKLPYIIIKCGYVNNLHKKHLNTSEKNIRAIYDNRDYPKSIIIPIYSNQEKICHLVREYIKKQAESTGNDMKIRVFCDGHLPIRTIKIAPMIDQNRVMEQVKSFCRSKYWLKDIEVSTSNIPYVPSINR